MAANRQLAAQRGISDESVDMIDTIHDQIDYIIDNYTLDSDYNQTASLVIKLNRKLQELWGFSIDDRFDTWSTKLQQKHFVLSWLGRSFKCTKSGKTVTLGKDIQQRQLLHVSDTAAIDLGVCNGYHRLIGSVKEVFIGSP